MTEKEKYLIARWVYKVGEEFISDEEYNNLHRRMLASPDMERITSQTWSSDREPTELLNKYNLEHFKRELPSYAQSESIQSLVSDSEVEAVFGNMDTGHLSYKIDGFNIVLTYTNGYLVMANTRGRGGQGKGIMEVMIKLVPTEIEDKGNVIITVELHTDMNYWSVVKETYNSANPRSAVSTLIANCDWQYMKAKAFKYVSSTRKLNIYEQYKELTKMGFTTSPAIQVKGYKDLIAKSDMLGKVKNSKDFISDGLVLITDKTIKALRVGAWQESVNYSILEEFILSPTTYGFSLTGRIAPIQFEGANRTKVNLYNIQSVLDNNIKVGDRIYFVLRSDANLILDPNKYN